LVTEQVDALYAPAQVRWDIRDQHLVVWTGPRFATEAVYDLKAGDLPPRILRGGAAAELPVLDGRRLLLSQAPIEWDAWVRMWEPDRAPEPLMPTGVPMVPVPGGKPASDVVKPRSEARPIPAA
jgi:hypothetical protein